MGKYPNVIEFHNNLINIIYPVGSIYMSVNNVSPATFLGGTWEQIQDTFLWCAGSKHAAGTTGGAETHTLTQNETPAHTHTRGTMNITGEIYKTPNSSPGDQFLSDAEDNTVTATGALYKKITGTQQYSFPNGEIYTILVDGFGFDASRNWTGATSSVGGSQAHNNMPPYLSVYVWKRTA